MEQKEPHSSSFVADELRVSVGSLMDLRKVTRTLWGKWRERERSDQRRSRARKRQMLLSRRHQKHVIRLGVGQGKVVGHR